MKQQPARDHIKLGEINNGETVDLDIVFAS